ncbi:MAG: DNA cytosine methyltransferase, partial [Patescibacteria group bacterium]|nr:DNA cytosine methyltransferase [Patescibacteria group bacterium]
MKILNLYSGIGGNRKLWTPKGDDHTITAVEYKPEIAKIYQDFFPNDKVIVADAHQYLLDHYNEFDFIWSSPPCPTHSDIRRCGVKAGQYKALYPAMELYQEIILLRHFSNGKWVVENVKPYYKPLIEA